MILLLLVCIPVLAGIFCFVTRGNTARLIAMVAAFTTLVVSAVLANQSINSTTAFRAPWLPELGVEFSLFADGMGAMLCLLTGFVVSVVFIANYKRQIDRPHAFFGLLLLAQAGITGVFLAYDALLFYFFWELALIPVYFLCSQWGGEKRIQVTFKFFVYTFFGSLLMLAALIYLGTLATGSTSFSWEDIRRAGASLPLAYQQWLFWLMFIAFAIKIPIFPFHTWQPDTYEQADTSVTIILSALMVKMGMFAVVRWLFPVFPEGVVFWANTVIILSIIGIVYASFIAIKQTDIKRLIAYSSIAHMGLMVAAAFAINEVGMHGLMVQMFNHGVNITGMWLLVSFIEQRYETRDMSQLGGLAISAPQMTVALLVVAFANIALPLTSGFIGEFMLFHGIFQSTLPNHIVYMVIAGLGVILGAVYTLTMVQRTAFGEPSQNGLAMKQDLTISESIAMALIVVLILFLGVYPAPLLSLTESVKPILP